MQVVQLGMDQWRAVFFRWEGTRGVQVVQLGGDHGHADCSGGEDQGNTGCSARRNQSVQVVQLGGDQCRAGCSARRRTGACRFFSWEGTSGVQVFQLGGK